MLSRIQKIMDEKLLSVSAFADEIGVKRPTMTHTMTGRNNPSLDIISKILERYQEISSDWLLFGKGTMYTAAHAIQPGLFDELEKQEIKVEDIKNIKDDQSRSVKISTIALEDDKHLKKSKEGDKKISKILIFFSDNTFETFLPEDNPKK